MTQEEKNNIIRTYLREQGFKPRDDKDINMYIRQLNTRLNREKKKLYIEDYGNTFNVYIGDKLPVERRFKALYIKVNDEEESRYKKLAEYKNTDISKLIRNLLEEECIKYDI